MLVFVLGLSFILLTVAFRSVVIAGTTILLNLLSVGATYGLVVLVFQHGVGADLLGFQQVDIIEAWVPLFLFAVLFGLSMDYQVFLLSRIRERYSQTGDTRDAIAFGIGSTARLITGAALIIVAVFLGFAMGDLVMFQQMGFGIAVALLIDATIVRSVLVPASMTLLGEWNWYLPSWLDWLPHMEVEGGPHEAAGAARGALAGQFDRRRATAPTSPRTRCRGTSRASVASSRRTAVARGPTSTLASSPGCRARSARAARRGSPARRASYRSSLRPWAGRRARSSR